VSCSDKTTKLPAGLTVISSMTSAAGSCQVDSKSQATHFIDARNRSLLTFVIAAHSDCQTSRVRYDTGLGTSDTWDDKIGIAGRPGNGGARKAQVQADLTCIGAAKYESIATDLQVTCAGWPNPATDSLQIQVETLG
jgi:hypothetical protein